MKLIHIVSLSAPGYSVCGKILDAEQHYTKEQAVALVQNGKRKLCGKCAKQKPSTLALFDFGRAR